MRAYSEKADLLLTFLKDNPGSNWEDVNSILEIPKGDGVITFLKNIGLLIFCEETIKISGEGLEFINSTSFVERRKR